MTGEHERERGGDQLPPEDSATESMDPAAEQAAGPGEAAESSSRPSKRFRAWGAAKREEPAGPSLWSRASERLKKIFSRPKVSDAEVALQGDEPALFSDEADATSVAEPEPLESWSTTDDDENVSPTLAEHSIPVVDPPAEEPVYVPEPVADGEPDVDETLADEIANEPKENLKFLWSADSDSSSVEDAAAATTEPNSDGPTADAATEPALDPEPKKKRPSLLKRIFFQPISFSRAKQPDVDEEIPDTGEYAIPSADDAPATVSADDAPATIEVEQEPEPVEAHAADPTLDEALPMDSTIAEPIDASADEAFLLPEPEPEPPKKIGFFGRIFGRKSVEAPPAQEVETEESEPVQADTFGTLEAGAVGQLDAADQGFEAARSELAPPEISGDQSFATVDDALPLDSATVEYMPAITDFSFAPPPALSEANVSIEAVQPPPAVPVTFAPLSAGSDEHSFFGGNTFDFDTPKADDRSTIEVTPVDERKTAEVTAADTFAPVRLGAAAGEHADEVERKTDEFDMVEIDGATLQEPAVGPFEGKTAEVPKVSIFKKLFSRTKEVTQVEPAVAPPPSANPTFLVQKFRTFYNEVVVYKNQKTDLTAGFATAIVTNYDADLSPDQAAQSLGQRLQQMLELQLAESSWMGGEVHELYPDAQYAMAVLADEMLTHVEWPGRGAWGKHRLELTVFKTAASDLELFKRVDRLLKNGVQTVGTRDLARVYLLAIASGFKGKYRPFDLPRALAEYRRRLYEFVYNGDALLLYATERRIFPEATSATVAGKGVKRFSMAQQWAAILVILLAGYTVVSHLAWRKVSADLKDIAARVEQARNPLPLDTPNGSGGR